MNTMRIALADDHTLFRKGMQKLIDELHGKQVVYDAAHGAELLQWLDSTSDKPDVILMDLNMPQMNGIEATRIIHNKYPNIKIIVLTVYDEEQFIIRLVECGADGYLFKNAEIAEVEKAIHDVISNGFYFNDKMLNAIRKGPALKNKDISFNSKVNLTRREQEILKLICNELTATEIADKLFISTRTVDGHRQNLLDKIGARNTAGLVIYAIKNKLLDLGF